MNLDPVPSSGKFNDLTEILGFTVGALFAVGAAGFFLVQAIMLRQIITEAYKISFFIFFVFSASKVELKSSWNYVQKAPLMEYLCSQILFKKLYDRSSIP